MTDRDELKKLRMSLVRIAQAVGIDVRDFPPILELRDFDFDSIVKVTEQDRGWNALAAQIVGRVVDRKKAVHSAVQDVLYRLELLA